MGAIEDLVVLQNDPDGLEAACAEHLEAESLASSLRGVGCSQGLVWASHVTVEPVMVVHGDLGGVGGEWRSLEQVQVLGALVDCQVEPEIEQLVSLLDRSAVQPERFLAVSQHRRSSLSKPEVEHELAQA
jgi:hypothetical protein